MSHRTGSLLSFGLMALLAIACGSTEGSAFDEGAGEQTDPGSSGGFNGDGKDGTSGGNPDDKGNACAAQEVGATRKPVKLLIVLDQSGSMGDGNQPSHDPNKKWIPVTTALKAFLDDPTSNGIEASMRLFPINASNAADRCSPAKYATPNVPMTSLPNSAPFSAKIVAKPTFSGTPTRAVLRSTVTDAKSVLEANKEAKVAIVLITDGEPAGCESTAMGNGVQDVADEVKDTKATIPTYVIGVGAVNNLNTIARGGGPRDAFIVPIDDPTATKAEFLKAVDEIRGASIACDVTIPPPPAGQTLDPKKVNVNYTPTGKPTEKLNYDESCASGGWHYDDKANPKKVILCPTTCEAAKADPSARLALEFGCATRGDVR